MRSLYKYFRFTVFFVLLLAYTFYDYLNSGNSGFDDTNRGSVYLFLVLIVSYFFIYLIQKHPKHLLSQSFIKVMFLLTIWIVICNYVTGRFGWVMYVHLFMAIWWILAYCFFYTYCSENPNSRGYIIGLFSLMLLVYLYYSYASQSRIQINRETEHVVLNYAYNILSFIPIILLIKNKTIKLVFLGLAISALFLSFKRGPLVILPMMYLAYQFGQPNTKSSFIKKAFQLFVVIILFYAIFSLVDSFSGGFLSSRFTRSELQYGSTRDELWTMAIKDIQERDFLTLLIGKGSGSSIDLLTSGVHNEWLEFLFSFGIIGVFLYFCFGISLSMKFWKMKKRNSQFAPIVGMLVAFFWMVGLFSGFYFVHASFYFFALLGILDSIERTTKLKYYYASE